MVTPFNDDLSIDWAGVEKLAAHLQSTGHDGIVVNGTTGEAPTTSDDEKIEIIKVVKRATSGKLQVIAGAGNNETSHSIEQAEMAAAAGADGPAGCDRHPGPARRNPAARSARGR